MATELITVLMVMLLMVMVRMVLTDDGHAMMVLMHLMIGLDSG